MNKDVLKGLPLGKRILYVIRYGTWHVITGAVVLALLAALIYDEFIDEKALLNVEMIDANIDSSNGESFDRFLTQAGYLEDNRTVEISKAIQLGSGENDLKIDPSRLFLCSMLSGKNDLYFWNEDNMDTVYVSKALMDLREVLSPEMLTEYADRLVYSGPLLDGGFPCGVSLEDNEWICEHNYYDHCIVGVATSAGDVDLVADFLEYILRGSQV